jgi:hypothetical protein
MDIPQMITNLENQRDELNEKLEKLYAAYQSLKDLGLTMESIPESTSSSDREPEMTEHQREQHRIFREERVHTNRNAPNVPIAKVVNKKGKNEKGQTLNITEEYIGGESGAFTALNFDEGDIIR